MTSRKVFKIILIAGLDCGLQTYHLLKKKDFADIVATFCLSPQNKKKISGYIDIKEKIKEKNIYYYKENVNEIIYKLKKYKPIDLVIAIGISDIIKKELLKISKIGVLGAHAAKLPERPGCSPIVWAILDGLSETEMTIFKMSEKIDSGPIYCKRKIKINSLTTSTIIRKNMDNAIIELLDKNLLNILNGKNKGKILKGKRNYTRKRGLRDGALNLAFSSEEILRKVRALSTPYPGAHFYGGDGKAIIIEKARLGGSELLYEGSGLNNNKNILCVVAHPDDEALGLGGTLIKHSIYGDKVNIIILSKGEAAKRSSLDKNPKRLENAKKWSEIAGVNLFKVFNYPDQKLDTIPQLEIVKNLEQIIQQLKPDIVYLHHPYDMNSDHQIAAQTTLAALRPIAYHNVKPEIRAFETPSSTEQAPNELPYIFKPNFYVDIQKVWKKKLLALAAYSNELKQKPHPRSINAITALAIKRGSEAGLKKAEAFYILRRVW